MGVMNRVMSFFGLQEEEEESVLHNSTHHNKHVESQFQEESDPNSLNEARKNKGNIVSIHSQKNTRVILNEPKNYDDTQEIADHLRVRRPVVVNLHRAEPDQALRIVDFLSGTVYALNGSISKIGQNIFLCTPDTVEIQGSITDPEPNDDHYDK